MMMYSSLQSSPQKKREPRQHMINPRINSDKKEPSFQDQLDIGMHQIAIEQKNINIKKSSPLIRHIRHRSSNMETQLPTQEDEKPTQNYFVGFEERRKQREKQIINSYFKNNNSYNGALMFNGYEMTDKPKSMNNSIFMMRDISPPPELNKSMIKFNNLENSFKSKNDSSFTFSQNQSGVMLNNIPSNAMPIKLAPLFGSSQQQQQQQKKQLRFEGDEIERQFQQTRGNLSKSTAVSRNISPINTMSSILKPFKVTQNSFQSNTKSQQSNTTKKNSQMNDRSTSSNYQPQQFTQSSLQYQTTINSLPSQQYISYIPDDPLLELYSTDINPQLYISYYKEPTLPIIDEADNTNECDPHQVKLKSLNSHDFRSGGNGYEVLSMEGSTTMIQHNLSPFPNNYFKRKCIGRSGFSKIYLCERKQDEKIFACKEVNFSLDTKAKDIYQNEIEFYQCFMRNSQVIDYFSKEAGFKFIPLMEYNESITNYMTNVEYGYLMTELLQRPLRKSLFDVRKETVGGEEMYQINLKSLYNHLVEEPDNFKRFIKDIAQYLKFLQKHNWSHGDLRLDNIVISSTQIGGSEFLDTFRVVDYGSSFRTNKFKGLQSHITPEYMPPEFLKHLIADKFEEEQLQSDVEYDVFSYAVDPKAPYSLDIWSLGCLILELILAVPLWVTQRCRIKQTNFVLRGLFSTKERKIEQIYIKQKKFLKQYLQIMKSLKLGNNIDKQIKTILDGCLKANPRERITPDQIIEILSASTSPAVAERLNTNKK